MRAIRNTAALTALALTTFSPSLSFAAETTGRHTYWLHEPVSSYANELDHLFYGILYLTVAVNIAVFVCLAIFLVKYRHRPGKQATFIHGNNRLELVWTLVPTIILAMISVLSQTTWARMKYTGNMPSGSDVVEVEVVGRQFQWFFHYPGKDGKLGPRKFELINRSGAPDEQIGLDKEDPASKDDFVTSVMVIPEKTKVYVHITSVDVIHSFFLPNFRLKQDAMPGLAGRAWLDADKTSAEVIGTVDPNDATPIEKSLGFAKPYDLVCAELCGQGHFKMKGAVYVVPKDTYEKFIAAEAAKAASSGDEGY